MKEIAASEAKNRFGAVLDRVEQGKEVVITRRGKAVARLVPTRRRADPEKARAASRRIRERAEKLGLGRFDWAEWKAYRDEGRP
jgi:prevent-host-death family protein